MKEKYPEKYICFELTKASRIIQRQYEKLLIPLGITPSQFYVLSFILGKDDVKFKEIARYVNIENPTLTGILNRLERNGFIVRKDYSKNRRLRNITLTDKAKEVTLKGMEFIMKFDEQVKNSFPQDEFVNCLKVIGRISESWYSVE